MIKVCCIGDAHDEPGLSKKRFDIGSKWLEDEAPDAGVVIGDFGNWDSLSQHPTPGSTEDRIRPLFDQDCASVQEAGERLMRRVPNLRIEFTEGNHEYRAKRWGAKYATIGDNLHRQVIDLYRSFGWKITPFAEYTKIGGVSFTHIPITAMGRPYGGKTAGDRILNASGGSVVHGHTHAWSTKGAAKITGELHRVVSLPCYLPQGHKELYMKHSPADWDYGAVTMMIHKGHIYSINMVSMKELYSRYG